MLVYKYWWLYSIRNSFLHYNLHIFITSIIMILYPTFLKLLILYLNFYGIFFQHVKMCLRWVIH